MAVAGLQEVLSRRHFDVDHVREVLRAACQFEGGQSAWADKHDLSVQYVNDVIRGRRDPGASMLAALGFEKIVRYAKCSTAAPIEKEIT